MDLFDENDTDDIEEEMTYVWGERYCAEPKLVLSIIRATVLFGYVYYLLLALHTTSSLNDQVR